MRDENAGDGDPIEAWLMATGGTDTAAAPDTDTGASDRRRPLSRRLLGLSVLPWIAVALLGATALQGQVPEGPPAAAPTPSTAPVTSEPPLPNPSPGPGSGAVATDHEAHPADAAAVVAVRTGAAGDEYIDTAAVEARTNVGSLTIVTVRAVRLVRSAGAWGEPQVIRAAVATTEVDGETVAVAPPWRLAAPAPAPSPAWEPLDDAALLDVATATARAAGYRRLGEAKLRYTDALSGVVSLAVPAAAPGDTQVRPHEILLTADASALLGTPAADPLPLPLPAEQP